ncbi:MAG TPA: hypothetical protein VG815_10960 [Chloroflexota bacterium]|nr:hypothetical protein [Chloroflexota bacterium]
MMKLRIAAIALACSAVMAVSSTPAVGATSLFRHLYNNASNTYSSFENIAMAHNKYVKHHHASCSAQKSQWWPGKATKDTAAIAGLASQLAKTTKKERKKPAYHDLLSTVHHLKGWSGSWILPRLLNCKSMPISNSAVALDLSHVANDVGLGSY